MDIFVLRFRTALAKAGMRQKDLVKATGFTDGQVSSWYNGKYRPNAEAMTAIAKALNVSPEWLIGQQERKPEQAAEKRIIVIVWRRNGETTHEAQKTEDALKRIIELTEQGAIILKAESWKIGG